MKNRFVKIALIVVAVLVVAVAGIAAYVKMMLPNVGDAPDLTIERTPERIARGEYLANSVALCTDCHSQRDYTKFAGPIKPETFGAGGELFGRDHGLPGEIFSRNITPAALSNWTDGELYRAITTGVSKDGHPLFPIMPYHNYAKMDDEDIYAIIAYLRTLPAIENEVPERVLDFPLNFIVHTIPANKQAKIKRPDTTDVVKYGEYMATMASCSDCHTPMEKDENGNMLLLSGGNEFKSSDGSIVRTANLTPHETGLKNWTKEQFVSRFKEAAHSSDASFKTVKAGDFNTPMPWGQYGNMKESDLEAIFTYLQSIAPIEKQVERFTPATDRGQLSNKE